MSKTITCDNCKQEIFDDSGISITSEGGCITIKNHNGTAVMSNFSQIDFCSEKCLCQKLAHNYIKQIK